MAFIQMNFLSESLMRTVNVNVILPVDKIDVTGGPIQEPQPFKTLYLLHGILGSHVDWINGTNIQRWAEEKNLAVVMPAGENSFYLDREETHELYGTYVGRDVEGPGKHEWDFWDAQIRQAIEWLPLSGNAGMNSGNVF